VVKDIHNAAHISHELSIFKMMIEHLHDQCEFAEQASVDVGVLKDFFGEGVSADRPKLVETWDETQTGTVREESDFATVGLVARKQEFGFTQPNGSMVPARSFVRSTAERFDSFTKREFHMHLDKMLKQGDVFGINVEEAFIKTGKYLRTEMKRTFDTEGYGRWAPLRSPTRNGRTPDGKPLLDTGQLQESIACRINESASLTSEAIARIDL